MSLDIRLGWRPPELVNVLADEPKVFALTPGRLARPRMADRRGEAALRCLDEQDGTVGEMDTEVLLVGGGKVGHFSSRELSRQETSLSVLTRHGYPCPINYRGTSYIPSLLGITIRPHRYD